MSGAVAALILAAGEGRRYGGPKALARHAGRSFLSVAVDCLSSAGLTGITVVIGAGAEQARTAAGPPPGVAWVLNEDWRLGRTGSITRGLAALPAGARAVLIHQVDFPHVRPETIAALVEAFAGDPRGAALLLLPTYRGRRGHPLIVGREIWPEIMALGPDEPLHKVVRRDPSRVREVGVPDPGIHRNINVPEEGEA